MELKEFQDIFDHDLRDEIAVAILFWEMQKGFWILGLALDFQEFR